MDQEEQLMRDLIMLGDGDLRTRAEREAMVRRIGDYIRDVACTEAEKEVNLHAKGYLHNDH